MDFESAHAWITMRRLKPGDASAALAERVLTFLDQVSAR